jgi:UDP-N-acetylglucosamine--N-acetylmuramyl-(pentapeptide) pyrophosphoryl-undecaprenol N-acetylglucosamine transferase
MPEGVRLLLAAGGTGGHLFPGIAVAEAMQQTVGAQVLFVGTANGMETEVIPRLGFDLRLIPAEQLRGRNWWGILHAVWAAVCALGAAWRVVCEFTPDVIFSIGGYASGPTVLVGWARRVPCVLLEPNAIPGLTNRLLGRLARRVCVGFPVTARFFPAQKAVCTGNPVRWSAAPAQSLPRRQTATFSLLVFGGSAGARHLNQTVPQALALLTQQGMRLSIVHQTGKADHAAVSTTYEQLGVHATVVPFIDNMQEVYATADVVICRAGATTLAELTVLGKPAILIPYPYAVDDHQRANAEVLVQAGAALMILNAELTPERLRREIEGLITDRARLAAMAQASATLGRPGATDAVVHECLSCLPPTLRPVVEGVCQ